MGTPQVQWVDSDLKDMVPGVAKLVEDSGLLDALGAYADFKKVASAVNAIKFTPDSIGSIPAVVSLVQQLAKLIDGIIGDFLGTGVYLLPVPAMQGGIRGFARRLNTALLNISDLSRPVFTSTATIAAAGVFSFSPDNRVTELAFDSLKKGFITKPEVLRALNLEHFETAGGPPIPHFQNIQALTAKPVSRSPWVNVSLTQMLPGVGDLLLRVKAVTTSLINTARPSAIQSYLDMANRQVVTLQTIVADIQSIIDFINTSFDPLPLHVFAVKPVVSGTQELADAIEEDFFDPRIHPEIKDADGTFFITGFLIVMGSLLTPASVEAKYAVLSTILGV